MNGSYSSPDNAPAPSAPRLDRSTVRALADAGFVSRRDFLSIARAFGWGDDVVVRSAEAEPTPPAGAPTDLDPMIFVRP